MIRSVISLTRSSEAGRPPGGHGESALGFVGHRRVVRNGDRERSGGSRRERDRCGPLVGGGWVQGRALVEGVAGNRQFERPERGNGA